MSMLSFWRFDKSMNSWKKWTEFIGKLMMHFFSLLSSFQVRRTFMLSEKNSNEEFDSARAVGTGHWAVGNYIKFFHNKIHICVFHRNSFHKKIYGGTFGQENLHYILCCHYHTYEITFWREIRRTFGNKMNVDTSSWINSRNSQTNQRNRYRAQRFAPQMHFTFRWWISHSGERCFVSFRNVFYYRCSDTDGIECHIFIRWSIWINIFVSAQRTKKSYLCYVYNDARRENEIFRMLERMPESWNV